MDFKPRNLDDLELLGELFNKECITSYIGDIFVIYVPMYADECLVNLKYQVLSCLHIAGMEGLAAVQYSCNNDGLLIYLKEYE